MMQNLTLETTRLFDQFKPINSFKEGVISQQWGETIDELRERYRKSDADYEYNVCRGADIHVPDDRAYRRILKQLSRRSVGDELAGNRHVRAKFRSAAIAEFIAISELAGSSQASSKRLDFWFVTILHADWNTTELGFEFDRQAAGRKIRNALAGLDYFGLLEFATYTNLVEFVGSHRSRVVSPHFHGIVWGAGRRRIEDLLRKRRARFSTGIGDGKSLDFKRLESQSDIATCLAYLTKSPIMGYRLRALKKDKFTNGKARLSYKAHLRMFHILNLFTIGNLVVAGGEGAEVTRRARAKLRPAGRRRR